jgi:hypothetical protein
MKISLLFKKMNIAIRAWKSKLLNIYFDKNISEKINKFVYWLMIKEVGNENDTQYLNNALANTIKQNGAILKQYREEHFSLDIDNLYTIYKKQYYREFQVIENEVQNKENATVEETILYFKTDYEYDLPIHVDVVNQLELPDLTKEYEFVYLQLKKEIMGNIENQYYYADTLALSKIVLEEGIESEIYFGYSFNTHFHQLDNIINLHNDSIIKLMGIYEILLCVKKDQKIIEKLREKVRIKLTEIMNGDSILKEESTFKVVPIEIQVKPLKNVVEFFNREVLYQDETLKLYQVQEQEGTNMLVYSGCDFFKLRESEEHIEYYELFKYYHQRTDYIECNSAFSIVYNYALIKDEIVKKENIPDHVNGSYKDHYYNFMNISKATRYKKLVKKVERFIRKCKFMWDKSGKIDIDKWMMNCIQLDVESYITINNYFNRLFKLLKYKNKKKKDENDDKKSKKE